ncbi:MAG: hypothetical protein KIT81_01650 [Alphaproteobacteria bacterium]|nr:hypothetical protein [Alphaproteobacteria bacterium]
MTPVPPSESDLAALRAMVSALATATMGFVSSPSGANCPWVALACGAEEMERLWHHQGLGHGGTMALKHARLKQAPDLALKVGVHKFRRAFFAYHWIGNVEFISPAQDISVYVGTIRGRTQPAMWEHLEGFRACTTTIFRDPTSAMTRP